MVSVLHKELGRKVETQAYVERSIAAERSKQIRTSSIWINHDTTVISPSLTKLVGKNKDGSALCVFVCVGGGGGGGWVQRKL